MRLESEKSGGTGSGGRSRRGAGGGGRSGGGSQGRGGGRVRGRGAGRGDGSGRRGGGRRRRRVLTFLQPCLLTLLNRGPDHGYNLMSSLDEFGFETEEFDPSLVYRSLRQMEDEGLVTSEWGEESMGPKRRIYQITAEGLEMLDYWTGDLRKTRDEIDRLLVALDKQ